MDDVIPKEKLTAYQRWELAAFDEARQAAPPPPAPGGTAAPAPAPAAAVPQEAIDAARKAAHAEGHAAGYAEGMRAARAAADGMVRLAATYEAALREVEARMAADVLDLALLVARQVIRTGLAVRPELLLGVVSEALAMVPSHHGHPTLLLHPADAAILHEALGQQIAHTGWRIVEDAALQRGDCRVESANSELDGTLQARWTAVVETIGTRVDWLSPDER